MSKSIPDISVDDINTVYPSTSAGLSKNSDDSMITRAAPSHTAMNVEGVVAGGLASNINKLRKSLPINNGELSKLFTEKPNQATTAIMDKMTNAIVATNQRIKDGRMVTPTPSYDQGITLDDVRNHKDGTPKDSEFKSNWSALRGGGR